MEVLKRWERWLGLGEEGAAGILLIGSRRWSATNQEGAYVR